MIKQNLQEIRLIEVIVKNISILNAEENTTITGYCDAIQAILLEDKEPSLELLGIIYERLEELKQSLE